MQGVWSPLHETVVRQRTTYHIVLYTERTLQGTERISTV